MIHIDHNEKNIASSFGVAEDRFLALLEEMRATGFKKVSQLAEWCWNHPRLTEGERAYMMFNLGHIEGSRDIREKAVEAMAKAMSTMGDITILKMPVEN